ncbi:MAG: hypothetical protein HY814_04170 [Candidatus Riflebacteria bacterium]|nr:hypothetical protein [Candidatus Riflebacteria bacterium]
MPPQRLVPAGSTVQAKAVSTPLAKDGEAYSATIGHFARLGVAVTTLEFQLQEDDGVLSDTTVIPIASLPALATKAQGRTGKVKLTFTGEKPGLIGSKARFQVKAVKFDAAGAATVEDVVLNDKNAGTATLDLGGGSVTFMVRALSGSKKGVKFTYELEQVGAKVDVAALVENGARLATIDGKLANPAQDADVYGQLLKAREENTTALAASLAADSEAGRKAAQLLANAKGSHKHAMASVLRQALKRARFDALEGGQVSDALRDEVLHARPGRGDDSDDSHDNLGYLINKKNENIHNLTHLQIDPQFIEGQLFKPWKLLELARGFPHLPLPDGLGLADYDEAPAKALLAQWAADFNVPSTTPAPAVRPAKKTQDLEQVKQVMRRLILAESIIEFSYNNGLVLAEDVASTVYDMVRLTLAGHSTVTDIAAHFEGVPIVGPVATALKKAILSKLLFLGEKFGIYIMARMNPPYSTYGPIVITVVANVASRVLHVQIENDNPGWLKDMGVKLMGKYALTAIPKIGYVARSQASVDAAAQYAAKLTAAGSYEDAEKKVWDDGVTETASSVREVVESQIATRHQRNQKEREIARVVAKISQIVGYASVLDPTNISKVVAIVGGVAAGGLLAHTTWDCGSYFFRLPKGDMPNGVRWAFEPNAAAAAALPSTLAHVKVDAAYSRKLMADLEAAYEGYQTAARDALEAARTRNAKLAPQVERLLAADQKIDLLSGKAEALVLGDGAGEMRGADSARGLYVAAQEEVMRRATVLSDTLARAAGAPDQPSVAAAAGPAKYLAALRSGMTRLAASDQVAAAVLVSRTTARKSGGQIEVTATLENLSPMNVKNVTVRLVSGLDFAVTDGPAVRTIARLGAGDERQVTWRIRLQEPKPVLAAQVVVLAEAEGVNILPKFQLVGE